MKQVELNIYGLDKRCKRKVDYYTLHKGLNAAQYYLIVGIVRLEWKLENEINRDRV